MSLELRQRLFAELDSLVLIDPHTADGVKVGRELCPPGEPR